MYIRDGFVCGGEPAEMLKVKTVRPLRDGIMILEFNNGETRLFDATVLEGEAFELLKNEEVFMHPEIEDGVVTWNGGQIDCAPEYMYEHSYEYPTEVVS